MKSLNKKEEKLRLLLKDFLCTVILLIVGTVSAFIFVEVTANTHNVDVSYILAITLVSRFTSGYIWGGISAIVGVIGVNYFFTYPYMELDFFREGYPITGIGMFIISVIVSALTVHIKKQATISAEREKNTVQLYEINKRLLITTGMDQIIELTLDYVYEFTQRTVIFYTEDPQKGKKGTIKSKSPHHEKSLRAYQEEFIVHWVFEHHEEAGAGTDTCIKAQGHYLPLMAHDEIWGVLGIFYEDQQFIDAGQATFLNLMIAQVAMAMESQHLSDEQQIMLIETEKEKMRSNLLRAVSHDLRTPLTGIKGASEAIIENKFTLTSEEHDQLIYNIQEDSNWLIHMVENLLSVTRIKDGNTNVTKTWEPVEEVISEAIVRIKKRYPKASIRVKVPEELLMVPMDATLIEQVIMNLVENAIKYSKSDHSISLIAEAKDNRCIIQIMDEGIGLIEENIETIFDGCSASQHKSSDSSKGMGIGLMICKTIIDAHQGIITAQNREQGGAKFQFTLPFERNEINE